MSKTQKSLYKFQIWDPRLGEKGLVADISDICTSRAYTVGLNRAETLDLSMSLPVIEERADKLKMTPQEMLGPGIHDIHVWRGNRQIFGTRVRYVKPTLDTSETFTVHASGYLDDFIHRYLWPVVGADGGKTRYENIDIGQIIMGMINTTQNLPYGNLMMQEGHIATSRPLTDDWHPFATNLKEIFQAITERNNSIDFSFSYDRRVNVHSPQQGRFLKELLFSYPGNIKTISGPMDASQVANVSINRGSGNGLDITPIETRDDVASQEIYGRMERIDDYADVSYVPTLQSFGDETLRTFATPLVIPDVALRPGMEPGVGTYWVGDWVRFSVPNRPSFKNIDGRAWRIHEIAVDINDMDSEDVRLTVANQ